MDLKNFISQALIEIVEGVQEAQSKLDKSGALINPEYLVTSIPETGGISLSVLDHRHGPDHVRTRFGQKVEFDVSVIASEKDTTQGGLGIQVASLVLGAGISGKSEDENTVFSRLKFAIPLFLPEKKS